MKIVDVFEFLGMVFSMSGAFLMSRREDQVKNAILLSFYCYLVANTFMIYVSVVHGLGPLLVQMIIFLATGVEVIAARTTPKARLLYLLAAAYIAILLTGSSEFKFEISPMEVVAAGIAVTGSYLFKFTGDRILSFKVDMSNVYLVAFGCFFVADLIYVFVALDRSMYFFLGQSAFFLYTSVAGTLNTLKTKKIEAAKKTPGKDSLKSGNTDLMLLKFDNNRLRTVHQIQIERANELEGQLNEALKRIETLEAELTTGRRAILETVKYCEPNAIHMWASRVIGILLNCDFKDADMHAKAFIEERSRAALEALKDKPHECDDVCLRDENIDCSVSYPKAAGDHGF